MQNWIVVSIALTLAGTHGASAQSSPVDSARRAALSAFADSAAIHALHFTKGDAASLHAAESMFTPAAWTTFLEPIKAFTDSGGAPQYTSNFEPAGAPVLVGDSAGVAHFRIPGVLTQTSGGSKTTYHVAVDVEVDERNSPLRIVRLNPVTCVGEAARHYCR